MDDKIIDMINNRFDRVDRDNQEIKSFVSKNSDRIRSLEDTRTSQRGIMAAGGVFVTIMSGIISWLVNIAKMHN